MSLVNKMDFGVKQWNSFRLGADLWIVVVERIPYYKSILREKHFYISGGNHFSGYFLGGFLFLLFLSSLDWRLTAGAASF